MYTPNVYLNIFFLGRVFEHLILRVWMCTSNMLHNLILCCFFVCIVCICTQRGKDCMNKRCRMSLLHRMQRYHHHLLHHSSGRWYVVVRIVQRWHGNLDRLDFWDWWLSNISKKLQDHAKKIHVRLLGQSTKLKIVRDFTIMNSIEYFIHFVNLYSLRLTIIVSLTFFLFLKIIVTLQYQCSIYYYFFPLLYPSLLNFIQLNYSINYN